jgi:tetratricopeptide (TPR) repeat protein
VETGVLVGEPGAYIVTQPLLTIQMPATVQAVLAARIDRLSPLAKDLLQTAAVIGTEVPLPLLQALVDFPEETLSLCLSHLQEAEFVYETRLFPDLVYTFKHALTQEVAYNSLLYERQRVLHARVVGVLETLAGDRLTEQVECLAHHALRGAVWDKALFYCRQAGDKAMARSAYREAVAAFEQALHVLPHLPETRDTLQQAIDLRLALRLALRPLGDFDHILTCLREAEALAQRLDDHRRLGQASIFLSAHCFIRGRYDQSIAAAQRALVLAKADGDTVLHALANQRLGRIYLTKGDYRQALTYLGQSLTFFDGVRRYKRFGQISFPAVLCRAYLAMCYAELGMFTEGMALGEEGLRIADAVEHPASLIHARHGLGMLFLRQGELPQALSLLEQAFHLCIEADLPAYLPWKAAALGTAYLLSGRGADAVPILTRSRQQAIVMDRGGSQVLCNLALGEAHLQASGLEEAQVFADHALSLAREYQERGNQAYALYLLGSIALQREPQEVELAETSYQDALSLAQALGMRPLQAHCYFGLGKLYGRIGQTQQSRSALSAAIALYNAMEMTFWLLQTRA